MSEEQKADKRTKLQLQILAFITIVVSSIGLYYGVNSGTDWMTWTFMVLISIAMTVAIWAS